ncbi:MAG TPA: glycosyltransferase family 4 protein [Herpetosiphonaceae bacterium]
MKIAMLTSSYPKWPGETTAPFIEEIAASVAARGHEVHVLMPHRSDLRRQPFERGVYLHTYRYAPTQALEVWGYSAALHGDVGVRPATLAAAPLALGSGLRSLLRLTRAERYDMIHGHWVLPSGAVAALVAQLRRLPLVLSLHGSDVFLAEQSVPTAWVAGWAAQRADAITSCSGDLAARLAGLGGPAERMRVIPYGIDAEQFYPAAAAGAKIREQLGAASDRPMLVWVSRMVYKKGLSVLLSAMPAVLRQHPTAVLVLGGYGDLRDALEQQARQLGIGGSVIFPGPVGREAINAYWNAGDLVVVPAIHDHRGNVDGLPNIILESMSAGRPIVASRVAGIPQVIEHERHGLLVPEGDHTALAAAITRLLDQPEFAAELGRAARRRVEQELRWSHIAARFEAVYLEAQAHFAAR